MAKFLPTGEQAADAVDSDPPPDPEVVAGLTRNRSSKMSTPSKEDFYKSGLDGAKRTKSSGSKSSNNTRIASA